MCLGNNTDFINNPRSLTEILNETNLDVSILGDIPCHYIDLEEDYTLTNFLSEDCIKVMHLNIHSFQAKRDQLLDLLCTLQNKHV